MDTAAGTANGEVLLNPVGARNVVRACNHVGASVEDLCEVLGLDRERQQVDARRWRDAAADVRDRVLESETDGVGTARRLGVDAFGLARAAATRVSGGIAEAAARRRAGGVTPKRADRVRFLMAFDDFTTPAVPWDLATYRAYRHLTIDFLHARNERIAAWDAATP